MNNLRNQVSANWKTVKERVTTAIPKRTLAIIALIVLFLSVPLGVYVLQQNQDIREFAAGKKHNNNGGKNNGGKAKKANKPKKKANKPKKKNNKKNNKKGGKKKAKKKGNGKKNKGKNNHKKNKAKHKKKKKKREQKQKKKQQKRKKQQKKKKKRRQNKKVTPCPNQRDGGGQTVAKDGAGCGDGEGENPPGGGGNPPIVPPHNPCASSRGTPDDPCGPGEPCSSSSDSSSGCGSDPCSSSSDSGCDSNPCSSSSSSGCDSGPCSSSSSGCEALSETPAPGEADRTFNLTVLVDGIGKAGDRVSPGSGGNTSPQTTNRDVFFDLYDKDNSLAYESAGTISYDSGDGNFQGQVIATLAPGSYTAVMDIYNHPDVLIPGIITVPTDVNAEITVRPVTFVAGDVNDDGSINILDFNSLQSCMVNELSPDTAGSSSSSSDSSVSAAATSSACDDPDGADLDDNGTIDLFDFNLFLREISNYKPDLIQ